jgi:hypothetical protein
MKRWDSTTSCPTQAQRVLAFSLLQSFAALPQRPLQLGEPPTLEEPETPARLHQLRVDVGEGALKSGVRSCMLHSAGQGLHRTIGG